MGLNYVSYPGDLDKEEFYSIMGEYFAEPQYRKELPYLSNKPNYNWRLYYCCDDFIGFIHYEYKSDFVEIGGLYILKEFRDNHFATKIIKEVTDFFEDYNQRSITNNPIVINIRSRLGFVEIGKRGSYSIMEKKAEEKK